MDHLRTVITNSPGSASLGQVSEQSPQYAHNHICRLARSLSFSPNWAYLIKLLGKLYFSSEIGQIAVQFPQLKQASMLKSGKEYFLISLMSF